MLPFVCGATAVLTLPDLQAASMAVYIQVCEKTKH